MPRVTLPPPIMTAAELHLFLQQAFNTPRVYDVDEVTDTGVILRMPVGPEHERPGGTVSGPTMMSISDAGAWLATLSRIGPVALSVTTNLNINFLRKPSLDADLIAEANLVKLGKRLSVSEVGCYSGDQLVSHATVTYSIPS